MFDPDPHHQPVSWTTTVLLALALALFILFGPAPGCAHGGGGDQSPAPTIYESAAWQANTVTALAYDLREDGTLAATRPAGCPPALWDRLTARARHLNDNWDGR
jgi:hypothetical protein